jgi:hypothetical protein
MKWSAACNNWLFLLLREVPHLLFILSLAPTAVFKLTDSRHITLLLVLSVLVGLLLVIRERSPHLTQLLSDSSKSDVGIVFLDLSTVLLGEEHETRQGFLGASALLGTCLQK